MTRHSRLSWIRHRFKVGAADISFPGFISAARSNAGFLVRSLIAMAGVCCGLHVPPAHSQSLNIHSFGYPTDYPSEMAIFMDGALRLPCVTVLTQAKAPASFGNVVMSARPLSFPLLFQLEAAEPRESACPEDVHVYNADTGVLTGVVRHYVERHLLFGLELRNVFEFAMVQGETPALFELAYPHGLYRVISGGMNILRVEHGRSRTFVPAGFSNDADYAIFNLAGENLSDALNLRVLDSGLELRVDDTLPGYGADADILLKLVNISFRTVDVLKLVLRESQAPTISAFSNQTINEDGATGALAFTVGDAGTKAGNLSVSGSSSNTTLVPNTNIFIGGSGANRTVTVTPAADQFGSAIIAITVSDGGASASATFNLTVTQLFDDSLTFNFTGAQQDFTVPSGVTRLAIEASGAQGGIGGAQGGPGGAGGLGGETHATFNVTPGTMYEVYVGGQGGAAGAATFFGGGGGGASDVRSGGFALADRIIVAGGGGGGGGTQAPTGGAGGAGGGLTGGDGADSGGTNHGSGGTQAAGGTGGAGLNPGNPGTFGQGGTGSGALVGGTGGYNGGAAGNSRSGSGGGGYYGGGAGDVNGVNGAGGGGGSSFALGTATSVTHQQGVRTGDGLVIIRW